MLIYISVNIIIVLLGFLYEIYKTEKMNLPKSNKKKLDGLLFQIPSFIMLFIILAFRGDFATDYKNYVTFFRYCNQFEFFDVLSAGLYKEVGYVFLSRLIGLFTNNALYLFIITSLIILFCFYSEFRKNSPYIWLSVLMFVTIGAFYISFNIMRQILAVSIVFAGSKYLYERNFYKYSFVVLLASLFHKSSLIMIIFYFILNHQFSIRNFILILLSSIVSMLYMDKILAVIQNVFYSAYTLESYGMTGLRYTNTIMPVVILIFILFHYKKLDTRDTKTNIWINSIVFYTFFSILGLKVQMVQRLSEFFAPYVLLLIPFLISQIKSKEIRTIYILAAIVSLISYNYITLSGTGYDPFYFIWIVK